MSPTSAAAQVVPAPTLPDLSAVKTRQQGAWSSGDYATVGTTLQIVGETLCEALDLRAGQKVLDVAAGNGNVTLAAARRWCEVVSTDYVPALLERGRERAAAERLAIEFREADAEALPFADASFDAVVSTFGVMFTADQDKAAAELVRVCKPGGKIGLANWTPDGFIGQLFRPSASTCCHRRASSRRRSGAPARALPNFLARRPPRSSSNSATSCFVTALLQHWLDVFKSYYGPLLKTFGALDPEARAALTDDLFALIKRFDRCRRQNDGRTERIPRGCRHSAVMQIGAALSPTVALGGSLHGTHCSILPHFAGVILACGCLIGMLGFSPRSGMGFLLTPMSSAHSWGRDVFALALPIQMLLWGAAQPFAGAIADCFGAAVVD